jgi:dynein heavy chain
MEDLKERIRFIHSWIHNGIPKVFWFAGLFSPQSFLTAILQNFSRKNRVAVDSVAFEYQILSQYEVQPTPYSPSDGCYINGLFIEGASWNIQKQCLAEAPPRKLFNPLPVVWLQPVVITSNNANKQKKPPSAPVAAAVATTTKNGTNNNNNINSYIAPVFRTPARAGAEVVATTGNSVNFVMTITLPSIQDEKFWIKRGVACFLTLNE